MLEQHSEEKVQYNKYIVLCWNWKIMIGLILLKILRVIKNFVQNFKWSKI